MAPKSVIEARFDMHEDQCKADKDRIMGRLDSIDNKIVGVLVFLVIQFMAGCIYFAIEGPPWQDRIEIADRGERK